MRVSGPASPDPDLQFWRFSTSKPTSQCDGDQTEPKLGDTVHLNHSEPSNPPALPPISISLPLLTQSPRLPSFLSKMQLRVWRGASVRRHWCEMLACVSSVNYHLAGASASNPPSLNHRLRKSGDSEVALLTWHTFSLKPLWQPACKSLRCHGGKRPSFINLQTRPAPFAVWRGAQQRYKRVLFVFVCHGGKKRHISLRVTSYLTRDPTNKTKTDFLNEI